MNIFDDFDFDTYYEMLERALRDGVHIVHQNYENGGFTFVWKRESEFAKGKMVRVAVTFCSPKDQFCRKIGSYNALTNWYFSNETILLPVGDIDSAVIVNRLRHVFSSADTHLYGIF